MMVISQVSTWIYIIIIVIIIIIIIKFIIIIIIIIIGAVLQLIIILSGVSCRPSEGSPRPHANFSCYN